MAKVKVDLDDVAPEAATGCWVGGASAASRPAIWTGTGQHLHHHTAQTGAHKARVIGTNCCTASPFQPTPTPERDL